MKKIILPAILLFGLFVSKNMFGQELIFAKGDKAPQFSAQTNSGKNFDLREMTKNGPVVMLFYRGFWCPYCSKQLAQLQDSLKLLTEKGATVVAITPETNESVDKTVEKTKASFDIISDTSYAILKKYGVNFKVEEATIERYKKFNIDIAKTNGNDENILPVPAVFIIGKDGTFKFIYFDKDYRKRPTVKELVENL